MQWIRFVFFQILTFCCIPFQVQAYVGPGAGLSAIGTLIVLIIAILVALIAFVWFPLRRLFNRKRAKNPDNEDFDMEGIDSKPASGRKENQP